MVGQTYREFLDYVRRVISHGLDKMQNDFFVA